MEDLEIMVLWCYLLRQITLWGQEGITYNECFLRSPYIKKLIYLYTSLRKAGGLSVSAVSKVVRIL